MKKPTQAERIDMLEARILVLQDVVGQHTRRIAQLEKPRPLTKQEILDAGGVVSLGRNGL